MRWQGRRQSTNINAHARRWRRLRRRHRRDGARTIRGAACGRWEIGIIIVILIASYFLGINPLDLLNGSISSTPSQQGQRTRTGTNDEERAFVATVLADTEDTLDGDLQGERE